MGSSLAKATEPLVLPPPKVTPGDTNNFKRVLDEYVVKVRPRLASARCVARWHPSCSPVAPPARARAQPTPAPRPAQYFEDATPFREDASWGNAKMVLMTTASISALVAQFYPLTFPDNRVLLGVCVVIYFALSGVLQFMVTFLDRDVTYRSLPAAAGEIGAGERAVLRTRLPRGCADFTFIVEQPQGTEVSRFVKNVGNYFTSSGTLVPERVKKDVDACVDELRRKRKAAKAT